jgi:hypothetical protein
VAVPELYEGQTVSQLDRGATDPLRLSPATHPATSAPQTEEEPLQADKGKLSVEQNEMISDTTFEEQLSPLKESREEKEKHLS